MWVRLSILSFGRMKRANTTFASFIGHTHIHQQRPRLCRRSSSSRGRWSRRSSSNSNTYCSLLSTKRVNFNQSLLNCWFLSLQCFPQYFVACRKSSLLWLPWCRCIICFVLTDEVCSAVQQKYLIMVTQSVNKGARCALRSIKWGCFHYKYIIHTYGPQHFMSCL